MLEVTVKFLIGLEVLLALILCFLIMIQRSKSGGGLGGLSGGSATEDVLGAGGASIVIKATVFFGVVFLLNTLFIAVMQAKISANLRKSDTGTLLTDEAGLGSGSDTQALIVPAGGPTISVGSSGDTTAVVPLPDTSVVVPEVEAETGEATPAEPQIDAPLPAE